MGCIYHIGESSSVGAAAKPLIWPAMERLLARSFLSKTDGWQPVAGRIAGLLAVLSCVSGPAHATPPARVVSLAPNLTAMVMELGAGASLAAVTPFCTAPDEMKRVPGGMQPEAEAVLALEPDLVLASSITPANTLRQLRSLGIRTEVFEATSLEQIRQSMGQLASLLEVSPPQIPATATSEEAKSAALLFGADTGYSAGCGTHAHEILQSAGLHNIAASVSGPWPQLSEEFLLAADPEIIIVADYGDAKKEKLLEFLRHHPLRKHLTAVRNGHVIVFPAQAFSIPGPAALEAGDKLRAEVAKL